ncbi:MAG: tripartite tricarboxylate transporter TctB family protein [Paracoccaceae bacterium]|nr:tripartite tricarboxylate transporter TctB family protein [Paracoccaceae bacterium]MDE2913130.1 tripartite tricarboxylate transporter TctB family protein [Paracoccaceae bacterium]
MTVRQADFLMAIATILMSLGLMWSSTDGLAIGWVSGKGPGSGFWPFWLAVGMLLCSLATLVRWFLRHTPESRSTEIYMSRSAVVVVGTSVGALIALLVGIHIVGTYFALLAFLLFYLKVIGRHEWPLTVMLVGGIPVFIFSLFEWALQIPLPKALTEEWFYPVFDIMYETDYFWMYILGSFLFLGAVSLALHKFLPGQDR